jgi:acyl dehydratase
MRRTIAIDQLDEYVGRESGPTEWFTMDQERINKFADATLDHQFIHVDPEKAKHTPFGSTIAHGFLTLSMLPFFLAKCGYAPEGTKFAVNYGLDKLRFLQPVKVNSELRATSKLMQVTNKGGGQYLFKVEVTVEINGEQKPALIAEMLTLFIVA